MYKYNKSLKNCICGKKPKLIKREIAFNTKFYVYSCSCGRETFAIKDKVCVLENWNAAIERLEKLAAEK